MKKTCSKCHKKLPATAEYFYTGKGYADGLNGRCKKCMNEYSKEYGKKYREEHHEYAAKYRKEHRKEYCEYSHKFAVKHRKEQCEYAVGRRREHPEYYKRYNAEYHKTIKGYLHSVYHNICRRCNNQADKAYKNYGGRGIEMKFESFDDFYDYVVNVLKVDPRGLDTHRIDNNKGYEHGNIVFITRAEHAKLHK